MTTLGDMLLVALKDHGVELRDAGLDLQVYAATRAAHLTTLVGQPGWQIALRAEADNVALRAALTIVQAADATDARLVGIIQGVLSIALRLPPA